MPSLRRLDKPDTAVTLDELRAQVLPADDEDAYLLSLAEAAQKLIETRTRRTLTTSRLRYATDGFPRPGCPIALPSPPLVSVQSVNYLDLDGTEQTLAAAYRVETYQDPGAVWPTGEWPAALPGSSVVIDYTAGYGDAPLVPPEAKQAIRLLVGHWYLHREQVARGPAVHNLPHALESLCGSLKWGDYS